MLIVPPLRAAQIWPIRADFADFGQISAKPGPNSVEPDQSLVESDQTRAKHGRLRGKFGRCRGSLVDSGSMLVDVCPNRANFGRSPAEFGRVLPNLFQHRSKSPRLADAGPNWPSWVGSVPNFGKSTCSPVNFGRCRPKPQASSPIQNSACRP